MAYYGYMHMSTIYVKKGDVLNGKAKVGYISDNGIYATGKHLHVQKMASNDKGNWSDTFASDSNSLDPTSDFKKYGEPSPNDITVPYHSTPYPYNSSGMHQGIDYSGVIDRPYEQPYAYSLEKAKMKVIDVIYNDKYFGNFVVLQIIGNKEEEVKNFNRGKLNDWSVGGSSNINQVGIKITIDEKPDFIYLNNNGQQYSSYGDNFVEDVSYKNGVYSCKINTDKVPSGTYIIGTGKYGVRKDITTSGTNYDTYKVVENNSKIDLIIKENRAYIKKEEL